MKKIILYIIFIVSAFRCYGRGADTLNLFNIYDSASYMISVADYKIGLQNKLESKANFYIHFIDSVSSISKDPVLYLEKGYCTSLDFYEMEDYCILDNVLMDLFLNKKSRIIKNKKSYTLNNTNITKRKTRVCNSPNGRVTGTHWVIKDAENNTTITELYRSKTKYAYRIIDCF